MSAITTAAIMELRARTNAGMMDCKRALAEAQGDMEEAVRLLRLRGLAIQVKRAGKEAKEGVVHAAGSADGSVWALVEVNCETDFVAKTDNFKAFAAAVAARVLAGDEQVAETMKDELAALVASTGENVRIRRVARLVREGHGLISSYIHMGGKVGVLVHLSCEKAATMSDPLFAALAHDIALHVAAAAPRWLDAAEVPAEVIAAEKDLYRQDPRLAGKPEKIVANAVAGKLAKFLADFCLLRQKFVKDDTRTVAQVIESAAAEIGDKPAVRRFARFQVGAA